ncbi:hypothetical protein [Absidia glauca]|uniref:Galactose oxidase n=1 Tax=Absidia glauca TaxID=4829 RepID=A0A163M0Q8_ABSGL|nr:hypothetical protein [Absidia glauca]
MMATLFALLVLSCSLFSQTLAIAPRVHQGCTAVGFHVYCYGGYQSATHGGFTNISSDHISADLSSIDTTSATPTFDNWTTLDTSNLVGVRALFSITALDDTRYMIAGGRLLNATMDTPAVLYDTSNNTWSALSTPPFYTYGGIIMSSDASTTWAYGGKLNGTQQTAPSNTLKLDLTSLPGTWTPHAGGVGNPGKGRYGHAAIFQDELIFYFGGFYPPPSPGNASIPVTMMNISFYNTVSDQWGLIYSGGDQPRTRRHHTATLISSSKVLIYGGTGSDMIQALPLLDYCYIYDMVTHNYTLIDPGKGNFDGPLMGHSVVQYKHYVYIMFGYNSGGYLSNDVHVLDVMNASNPTWASGSSPSPSEPDRTNKGAIIGGVIGGVVFVAIIAGALIYWRRKKRTSPTTRNDFDIDQPQPPPAFTAPTFLGKSPDTYAMGDAVPVYQSRKPDDSSSPAVPTIKPSAAE